MIPTHITARQRILPPDGMTEMERQVWHRVVQACSAEHFIEADIPLLMGYCQAFVQQQRAIDTMKHEPQVIMADNGKVAAHPIIGIHKSLSGTVSNLAMRLRLSPSTRIQTTNKAVGSDLPSGLESDGDETDRLFAH